MSNKSKQLFFTSFSFHLYKNIKCLHKYFLFSSNFISKIIINKFMYLTSSTRINCYSSWTCSNYINEFNISSTKIITIYFSFHQSSIIDIKWYGRLTNISQSLEILHLNISLRNKPNIGPLLLTQLPKLNSYTLIYPSSYFVLQEDSLILSTSSR